MEDLFISYLNVLEGLKTRIKNLHWAADKLGYTNSLEVHEKLDELFKLVSGHQDDIAEVSQGILGNYIELDSIKPNDYNDIVSVVDLYKILLTEVDKVYSEINDDVTYTGIKSDIDNFINSISKLIYLFSLIK